MKCIACRGTKRIYVTLLAINVPCPLCNPNQPK